MNYLGLEVFIFSRIQTLQFPDNLAEKKEVLLSKIKGNLLNDALLKTDVLNVAKYHFILKSVLNLTQTQAQDEFAFYSS